MSAKNPDYDFRWCPGCGDFGARRALEFALRARNEKYETPMANTVIVSGIGCSGNLVHLVEGAEQPFGIHGLHGRTLPLAFGVKMSRPELNVVVVAGDGDFLSIGAEHIGPQAHRNLDVTAMVLDNGVYGLTKGQSSPTSKTGMKTTSTPYGKIEAEVNPLSLYLALGVSFIGVHYSSRPRDLAALLEQAMEHRGFAIVHVLSPCTTYNDTYEQLKGNRRKGIEPAVQAIPADHDPADRAAAEALARQPKVPVGLLYREERPSMTELYARMAERAASPSIDKVIASYAI